MVAAHSWSVGSDRRVAAARLDLVSQDKNKIGSRSRTRAPTAAQARRMGYGSDCDTRDRATAKLCLLPRRFRQEPARILGKIKSNMKLYPRTEEQVATLPPNIRKPNGRDDGHQSLENSESASSMSSLLASSFCAAVSEKQNEEAETAAVAVAVPGRR
jgi:hypothetical protein